MPYVILDKKRKIVAASDTLFPASIIAFYEGQGYTIEEAEYERGYNGNLYRKGKAPKKPAELVQAELEAGYKQAVQNRLDTFARTKDYDSIMSVCSYATSTDTTFRVEGERAVALRDATWKAYFTILEAIVKEQRTAPTVEELLSELPELTWE